MLLTGDVTLSLLGVTLAYEYLSSRPAGSPRTRLTGGCLCHFIISSRDHLGLREAAEATQYTCSIELGFT